MLVDFIKNNRKQLLLIGLSVILVMLLSYYEYHERKNLQNMVYYSDYEPVKANYPAGSYHESIKIKLTPNAAMNKNIDIYYTLDGNDPRDDNGILYSQEIELKLNDDITVYPLKYIIYYDGEKSDIYERDYILTKKDYFNLPIISISTDEDNLYNPQTGLFIKENYLKREDEWIRQAHIMMIENDRIVLNQGVGLQLSGRASANYKVKNFKLNAGEPYDAKQDKLILETLNNQQEYSRFSNITEYNSIRLRSGPQDIGEGNIRTALLSKVTMNSHFAGYAKTKKAIMYLNGKFYSLVDIQENYSNSFLKNRFDLPDASRIEKIKGGETDVLKNGGVYDYFLNDLNKEVYRKELEKYVDMDDLLTYYAIEILSNNADWKNKNYEMWRYTGQKKENNKYTDGRFRFLFYDADLTYYLKEYSKWRNADYYVFENCLEEEDSILRRLLKSSTYKNQFLVILQDLLNTSFQEQNLMNIVDEEYRIIQQEVDYFYDEKLKESTKEGIDNIKKGISFQNKRVEKTIQELSSTTQKYNMTLEVPEGAIVFWNQMVVGPNSKYEQNYYSTTTIPMEAQASPGYVMKGYIINEQQITGKEIQINKDLKNQNNKIHIQIMVTKINSPELIISEVSAKSDSDWMKFTNVSNNSISLKKYYISDEEENKRKYQLPDITLEPKKSIIINGKKNYYSMGDYICNFSLNNQEHLYLFDSDIEETIEVLDIPRMSSKETYGRLENSNQFVFYDNSMNQRKR